MSAKKIDLVRYVSPFGSPATMPREQAQRLLDEDDARWELMQRAIAEGAGPLLSDAQRAVGPPRFTPVKP